MNTKLIKITEEKTNLVFKTPGRYVVYFSNISGKISCSIEAEKIELYLLGCYDLKDNEKYSIHTEQIHRAPCSFSDMYVASVLEGESSLQFTGLIRIEKTAHNSHAYQKNKNLIVSPHSFVDSRPILEILANDVFCTHGSTSGPISMEQQYYLQTKGIDRAQSKQLIIDGFKHQITEKALQLGVTL